MENSELKSIAVGVLATNHWPTHLGLTTDTDRIEWLARQVERLVNDVGEFDGEGERLSKEVETLEDRLRDRDSLLEDLGDCDDCKLCADHHRDVTA